MRSHTPDRFKSRISQVMLGIIGFVLAYLLGSLALDSGSWWHYLGALIILILGIKYIVQGAKSRN